MASSGFRFPPTKVLLSELGGAVLGGIVFAPLAYIVTGYLFMGAGLGMGLLVVQIFGIIIGFGIGAGLGVGLVGRYMGQNGNIWIAMAAGGVTALVFVLLLRVINIGGLGGLFVGIPLALGAAIVGYHFRMK